MGKWRITVARCLGEDLPDEDGQPLGMRLIRARKNHRVQTPPDQLPPHVREFLSLKESGMGYRLHGMTAARLESLLAQPFSPVLDYRKKILIYQIWLDLPAQGVTPWINNLRSTR